MNPDALSRDQLHALVRLYQATAEMRTSLNLALLEKSSNAGLAKIKADLSAWAGFHDELTMRVNAEIARILSGEAESPAILN